MPNEKPPITEHLPNYYDALVTFRDLLDDGVDFPGYSEYVRGGVNLIADLFPRFEIPIDVRMDEVLEDLRRLDQHMSADDAEHRLALVAAGRTITTNEVAHVLAAMGYGEWSAGVLEGHAAGETWVLPND